MRQCSRDSTAPISSCATGAVPKGVERRMENVWEYPRPPRLEATSRRLQVVREGEVMAETTRARRVLETSHPPTYYFPPEDVRLDLLTPSEARDTLCEWKGGAEYLDLGDLRRIAWRYPRAAPEFAAIEGWIAFYARAPLVATVDAERAEPQPGEFYGGWITPDLIGPFKGSPGTLGW